MCPVVMSTTYGEREGKLTLTTAWEILGGRPCSGICGYIADATALEMNLSERIEIRLGDLCRGIYKLGQLLLAEAFAAHLKKPAVMGQAEHGFRSHNQLSRKWPPNRIEDLPKRYGLVHSSLPSQYSKDFCL